MKVQTVGFDAGFVAPPAAAEFQPQVIHDAIRNLVQDGKDILQLAVETVAPEWNIVRHPDEPSYDAQITARTQHRALHHPVRLQLFADFSDVAWFVLESKG